MMSTGCRGGSGETNSNPVLVEIETTTAALETVLVSITGTETPHTAAPGYLQPPVEFFAVTATQRKIGSLTLLLKRILGPVGMEQSLRRGFTVDLSPRLLDRLSAQAGMHHVWIGALQESNHCLCNSHM